MFQILSTVSPLFFIIFASAALRKNTNIGLGWEKALNEFALKIGLPALLFINLSKANISLSAEKNLIIANSIFLIGGIITSIIIGKILKLKKTMFLSFFLCFMFGNFAYLGIPVLTRVAGNEVLPDVSLIIAIYLFWIFTLVISYLDYSNSKSHKNVIKKVIKNLIKNPLLLSVIMGLLFSLLKIKIPEFLNQTITMISTSVTPIVLVVIGLFIGQSEIGKLKEWIPVLCISASTLILLPACFYYGVQLAGYTPTDFFSSIIEAAMPLAITPFALADEYQLNKKFISRSIVLSTTLSVVTIPFWIKIVQLH